MNDPSFEEKPIVFGSPEPENIMFQKSKSKTKRVIFIVLLAASPLIIIGLFVLSWVITNAVKKSNQERAYNQAAAKCGKDPVAVVEHHQVAFENYYSTEIITSNNPNYGADKAANGSDVLGNTDKVLGYYCSVDEAKTAHSSATATNSSRNYTTQEQLKMAASIIDSYATYNNVSLYQITKLPSKLKLNQLTVVQKNSGSDEYGYEPYNFKYILSTNNKYDSYVSFRCGKQSNSYLGPGWLTGSFTDNSKFVTTDLDKSMLESHIKADVIESGSYYKVIGTGQGWGLSIIGKDRPKYTVCWLSDLHNLLTKQEGDDMVLSITELDTSKISAESLNLQLN